MSLPLNGSTQYLTIADAAILSFPDGDWTIAGWVKIASNVGTGVQYFIGWNTPSGANEFQWYVKEASFAGAGTLGAQLRDGTHSEVAPTGTATMGTSTAWQHLAFVRSSNILRWYIDGVEDMETATIEASLDAIDGVGSLYLGSRNDGSSVRTLNGRLAEWAKWDRALTEDEILSLVAGTQPGDIATPVWWLPLLVDKEPDVGELTTAVEGAPSFDADDHPVSYTDLSVWATKAIADTPPGKHEPPGTSQTLSTRMCVGERSCLSFCIRAIDACTVTLAATDVADAPDLDLWWVKKWWQSPTKIFTGSTVATLQAGPLLKDPTLITTDDVAKTNTPADPFTDAETIQPISLPANETQQVWVRIHVPTGTAVGTYTLPITITVGETLHTTLNVSVEVLPFTLSASPIVYGVHHCSGAIAGDHQHETRTNDQIGAELLDIAQHGCTAVISYEEFNQLYGDETKLAALAAHLALYTAAGLSIDNLYLRRTPISQGGYTVEQIETELPLLFSALTDAGVTNVYCYGYDEPPEPSDPPEPDDIMVLLNTTFGRVHTAGQKTMTSLIGRSEAALANLTNLDLPIFSDPTVDLDPWHALSKTVGKYEATIWVNSHETHYRKFYGLEAYREGYRASFPFAYRWPFGESFFDDLDTATGTLYRDHLFTLPTTVGSISMLPWEAYREAINDVRYAKTLVDHEGSVPDPTGLDMDDVREAMIDSIIALRRPCIVLT